MPKRFYKGFIIDSEDDEPLIGASIKIIGQNIGSVTDLSGNFKISNLNKGEYSLRISYLGMLTKNLRLILLRVLIISIPLD